MKTSYLIFAALGAATVLLLTTDKGKALAKDIAKELAKNADGWKDKFSNLADNAGSEFDGLKKLLSKEAKGLSKEAREKILGIINENADLAKKTAAKQLA